MHELLLTSVKAVPDPLWSQSQTGIHIHTQHSPLLCVFLLLVLFTHCKITCHSSVPSWLLVQTSLCCLQPKQNQSSCTGSLFFKAVLIFSSYPFAVFCHKSPQHWPALLNRCVELHTWGQMAPFSHSSSFSPPYFNNFPSVPAWQNTSNVGGDWKNQGFFYGEKKTKLYCCFNSFHFPSCH